MLVCVYITIADIIIRLLPWPVMWHSPIFFSLGLWNKHTFTLLYFMSDAQVHTFGQKSNDDIYILF